MIFCKHEWMIISETTTKSQFEHMKEHGFTPNKVNGFALERKHIQVVICIKCGKLKRFVEDI